MVMTLFPATRTIHARIGTVPYLYTALYLFIYAAAARSQFLSSLPNRDMYTKRMQ